MKHLMKRAWTKYALVALVTALVVAPTAAIAIHGFTDVPNDNIFHNNIQWMKDTGVTLGCNPPANDRYCPNNTVTRGQMAAFMQRLAENKVVDAKTAVTAETATDADNLDGMDSTAFAASAHTHTAADITNGVGVASASSDSGSLSGGIEVVTSVTITAPSAGFVYATADAQMNMNHVNGTTTNSDWGLSMSATAFDQNHQDNAAFIVSTETSGLRTIPGAVTGIFPVTAGSNTVYFLAAQTGGSVSWNDATLTVLFVPTSVGPVTTASVTGEGSDPTHD